MSDLLELLLGLIGAFLVGVAIVAVIDYLDEEIAKEKIREQFGNTIGAQIKEIVNDGSKKRITFADLNSDKEFAIKANEVDGSFRQGTKIYV